MNNFSDNVLGIYLIIIGVFLVASGEKNYFIKSFNLFFNNYITIASSDNKSGLLEASTTTTTLFIIAARFIASFKLVNHTRNKITRKDIIFLKQPTKRLNSSTQRSLNNYISLVIILVRALEREY